MARSGSTRNNLPTRPQRPGAARPPAPVRALGSAVAWIGKRSRREQVSATVGLLALVAIAAYLLWPSTATAYRPTARARQYTNYTACLLTDEAGLNAPVAAPVWAGMQAASKTTHEQVSYFTMQGPDNQTTATATLTSLTQRGCDLIVTTGSLPDKAALAQATRYPKLSFASTPLTLTAASTTSAEPAAQQSTPSTTTTAAGTTATATTATAAAKNLTAIPGGSADQLQAAVDQLLVQGYHSIS